MFDSGVPLSPTLDALPRTVSSLNRYPESLRRWLLPRYPRAIRELSRRLAVDHQSEPIDLLISTSSAAVKSIQTPPGIPHFCYCHAPARYLWSQKTNYTSADLKGRLRGIGLSLFAPALRNWDRDSTSPSTCFIANSSHTASQIKSCYQTESVVIHPPVRTDFFTPDSSVERGDHLLLVSALEPYKRIDLAIDAAIKLNRKLVIVGSGSHESSLRALSGTNPLVTFTGKISDQQLRDQYRSARMFLFPQIEDFGITAVEAQACGTPVVAQHAGGGLDSVIDGSTGCFFNEPTTSSLAEAIENCPPPDSEKDGTCRANSLRFSREVFESKLRELLSDVLAQA